MLQVVKRLGIGSLLMLGLLAGCASNRAATVAFVEEAKATVADITRTQAAARSSPELKEAEQLLQEAEAALAKKEYTQAREQSIRAIERAKVALLRAELSTEVERAKETAKEAQNVAKQAIARAEAAEAAAKEAKARLAETEEAFKRLTKPVEAPSGKPTEGPSAEPMFLRHIVKPGETLWRIAGYPETYGNHLAWPLIYEANKEAIEREGGIRPGQVLLIPKDVPEAKMQEAIQQAIKLRKTKRDWASGVKAK